MKDTDSEMETLWAVQWGPGSVPTRCVTLSRPCASLDPGLPNVPCQPQTHLRGLCPLGWSKSLLTPSWSRPGTRCQISGEPAVSPRGGGRGRGRGKMPEARELGLPAASLQFPPRCPLLCSSSPPPLPPCCISFRHWIPLSNLTSWQNGTDILWPPPASVSLPEQAPWLSEAWSPRCVTWVWLSCLSSKGAPGGCQFGCKKG